LLKQWALYTSSVIGAEHIYKMTSRNKRKAVAFKGSEYLGTKFNYMGCSVLYVNNNGVCNNPSR